MKFVLAGDRSECERFMQVLRQKGKNVSHYRYLRDSDVLRGYRSDGEHSLIVVGSGLHRGDYEEIIHTARHSGITIPVRGRTGSSRSNVTFANGSSLFLPREEDRWFSSARAVPAQHSITMGDIRDAHFMSAGLVEPPREWTREYSARYESDAMPRLEPNIDWILEELGSGDDEDPEEEDI